MDVVIGIVLHGLAEALDHPGVGCAVVELDALENGGLDDDLAGAVGVNLEEGVVLDVEGALLHGHADLDRLVGPVVVGGEEQAGSAVGKLQAGDHIALNLDAVLVGLANDGVDLVDLAAQEVQQVQGVQGLVDHGAAAGVLPGAAPGLDGVVINRTAPGHEAADADDLAVLAGVDDLLQLFGGLVHAVLQADADLDLGMGGLEGLKLRSLGGGQGDGLLAEDVAAHLDQIAGHGEMQIVGQAVVDHIGLLLGDHLLVVGVEGGTLGNAGLELLVQVTGGDQLDLGVAQDAVEVDEGNVAQADDCSTNHGNLSLKMAKPAAAYAAAGRWIKLGQSANQSRTGNLPSAAISLFSSALYSASSQG